MTNADRIRAMTDEELAEWIFQCLTAGPCPASSSCIRDEDCVTCWLNWLKQEINR